MKIIKYIIIVPLLLFIGCSSIDIKREYDSGGHIFKEKVFKDGVLLSEKHWWCRELSNSKEQLLSEEYFKDGKLTKVNSWYEDGQQMTEGNYKDCFREVQYYRNGQKSTEQLFDDKGNGIIKYWDINKDFYGCGVYVDGKIWSGVSIDICLCDDGNNITFFEKGKEVKKIKLSDYALINLMGKLKIGDNKNTIEKQSKHYSHEVSIHKTQAEEWEIKGFEWIMYVEFTNDKISSIKIRDWQNKAFKPENSPKDKTL